MLGHDWIVPLGAAVANLLIGGTVLWRGARGPTTRTFAWMTAMVALWNVDVFALYYFEDPAAAEFWSRLFRTGLFLAPSAVFHSTLFVAEERSPGARKIAWIGHAIGLTFAAVGLVKGTLVRDVAPHQWGWYPIPTRLYAAYGAFGVVYLVMSLLVVWRRYKVPVSARHRLQAKFFFVACVIQVAFVLTNFLPIYGMNVYPLGNLGNVLWLAIIAYSIVRHRFMDLDYVVRKVVSLSMAGLCVLVPSSLVVVAIARAIGVDAPILVACIVSAVGLLSAVLIPTLQQAIETRVQEAIFAHRYDYRLRLRVLSSDLVHILDERELVRRLGEALTEILEVESCAILLRDERSRALAQVYPEPRDKLDVSALSALDALTEPMLTAELEAIRSPAAPLFVARGWEVALPLRVNNRLTGLVALTRNRDFRIVSREDLTLLAAVASAASVALENARLSRELRRSETALERANRLSSIGTLAAGIAHEIRNPLTAVKTFLDLLPQRLDDPDFVSSFRELSLNELRRVTNLINELLAFGRSTSAERRAVDLAPTLDQVVRLLESTARKRQVSLELHADSGVPPVWADADQVKQIVLNLVLNAIDASAADDVVSLALYAGPDDQVTIEVRDHGTGIPREQLESIFHPFFTTKETGTGLGLSLVHQMVVEHGGEIAVDSEVGHGTVFRVTLPVSDVPLQSTGT
ncbi:MAG TPA: ATP-binding protein [Candidatus Eisenbacteria bacterium]|nr:ATP-binding protein [Candidatus Eisenbacteria bacterium]